ncbi:ABC transporter permease [Pseudomonas sp. RL]|uniref:MlaE family ABC transporter permease n=1 Tax=Pseudomonas sp. RL TaxID=1452718 RepID=UPI00068C4CBD|nr:ABC transporter permease [Pseudomonas sp. RL]
MIPRADIRYDEDTASLRLGGAWTLAHYARLQAGLARWKEASTRARQVDMSELQGLDTAGAALLAELFGADRLLELADRAEGLSEERRALLRTVARALQGAAPGEVPPRRSTLLELLEQIGRAVEALWRHAVGLLGFIGLVLTTMASVLLRPRRWRMTSLVAHLEQSGLDAVPIVALLTFMVGAVVAFLGATVLADFGATQYTVDLVAYSFLREFGVLLTAILLAGRTASAFTAQIGSMKANEELDAIRTLGLDPLELLVLPRVFALLIALPLLTFIAMLSGMLGGAVVCMLSLDIPPSLYLSIIQNGVDVRHFLVGMAKAPIFAFLIAVIGCLEGFRVSGSAQSVGEHTTSSVVQSIFMVILVDALAALFLMEMGW